MNDIIITYENPQTFKKGFIPEEGQRIFLKCPICNKPHRIQPGQGKICSNNICKCGFNFGDSYTTNDIFDPTYLYFAYSSNRFLKSFLGQVFLDDNNKLNQKVSKVIGETYFVDTWYINYEQSLKLYDCIIKPDGFIIDAIVVNVKDKETLLYVYQHKIPLKKVVLIDNNYNVVRPKSLIVNIDYTTNSSTNINKRRG